MELTSIEHSIILGTLLGDGFLQKRGQKARLRICHSWKQKEYVDWKYQQLIRLCQRTQKPIFSQRPTGQIYSFSTQSEKILLNYYDLFYNNGLKTIRPSLINSITDPLSLAVWWLDDGNARLDCYSGRLATQAFSLKEHKILQQLLFKNFEIQTNIVKHSIYKKQYYLYIPSRFFSKLVLLIRPYVQLIPTLLYKLGKTP
uniref:Putative LAGLIDADG homing endonuclease n=1 Tax=Tydemania expeditionis TaxID=325645 RepID=A0A0D6E288_TYDEX|nr:putative LAGLIDADG homing endonuclease [Tydemania expeditionis]CEO91110.1 putative LAGLIDADG homing endonuclease [Tydemania expeditionis]